jgi:hypothetical protein
MILSTIIRIKLPSLIQVRLTSGTHRHTLLQCRVIIGSGHALTLQIAIAEGIGAKCRDARYMISKRTCDRPG